jgi:hypothetical protein
MQRRVMVGTLPDAFASGRFAHPTCALPPLTRIASDDAIRPLPLRGEVKAAPLQPELISL